ncbi:MAG: hypothetical protein HKN76_08710, partial [Saprospiraceae bacterium]|nr:hypothetical protein [Saprospiraceae bacterium]
MDKQKFIELLFKRAEGLISGEESHQLQAWLKASPNHRKYEEKVNEILHRAEKPGKVVDLDLEAEYVRLGSRIKKEDRNLKLKRMRRGFQIAAGFAVLIIALWFLVKPKSTEEFVIKQTLMDVDLADGSKINLAEGSFARFYDEANSRRLQLTGKAYFEIEKHTGRPFIIQTGQGSVTVVGTILEVDAGQQDAMEVRVKEGHVIVRDATGKDSISLTAGEGAAWQSGEFIRLES